MTQIGHKWLAGLDRRQLAIIWTPNHTLATAAGKVSKYGGQDLIILYCIHADAHTHTLMPHYVPENTQERKFKNKKK